MAYRRRARILLDYLELQDGERVLDCGCGMGFYLMAMGKLRRLQLVGSPGNAAHRSISPKTMSSVPRIAETSASICPFESGSMACRWK